MFSGLVNLIFGSEARQSAPVDSAVDVANVQEELGDFLLDVEGDIPGTNNDEDKENAQGLIDFETNEDDDWLLVNIFPANRLESEGETCLEEAAECQPSSEVIMEEKLPSTSVPLERSEVRTSVHANSPESEPEKVCLIRPRKSLPKMWELMQKKKKHEHIFRQEVFPHILSLMQDFTVNSAHIVKLQVIKKSDESQQSSVDDLPISIPGNNQILKDLQNHSAEYPFSTEWGWVGHGSVRCVPRFSRAPGFHGPKKRSLLRSLQLTAPCNSSHEQPAPPCVAEKLEFVVTYQTPQAVPPSKAEALLEHIQVVKPEQKAREMNIRKYLAPSHMDRQNKVKLYEGKAKNNRRKDLWRCHSGANNNRKCC